MTIRTFILGSALFVAAVAGCGPKVSVTPPPGPPPPGPPPQSSSAAPSVRVGGTVVTGLDVPWGMAFLADGSALVSERDSARILHIRDGSARQVGTVDGVVAMGEGGLLGIAHADGWVFAYLTTAEDNRVVRMRWNGGVLGAPDPILTAIPKAVIHDGGRLAVGPDGMLYVGTGDAGTSESAQDPGSLAGKILRISPDGSVPADNPMPGSPVFSLGHRNVQGLAFDAGDRLWASEFGQSDVDELNLISPGANYGWPDCEGSCGRAGFVDPVVQWQPTSIASPSGLAIVDGFAYVASLRGQTLWQVPIDGSAAATRLELGDLGRLRTVTTAPDGALWLSTSNTDGRGDPREGDDRILRLVLD